MSLTRQERNQIRVARYQQINQGRDPRVDTPFKVCYRCSENLPSTNYSLDATKRDGLQSYCIMCARKRNIEYRYGIPYSKYEELEIAQNYLCAICRRNELLEAFFVVDHDHACCSGSRACGNCVRGLLCSKCNKGLGNFEDDIAVIESASRYLKEYNEVP